MTRHHQAFQDMLSQHQQLFSDFQQTHNAYVAHPQSSQNYFNELGKQVLSIIRDTENRLCAQTERGGYSKYSANLSEKFWSLVRSHFPKIDLVGTK